MDGRGQQARLAMGLVSAGLLIAACIKQGGKNELHAHRAQDATWLVLEGQVTFYDENRAPVGARHTAVGL